MRASPHLAARALAVALVCGGLAGLIGAVGALGRHGGAAPVPQQQQAPAVVSAAAYRAQEVAEAGHEARIPYWSIEADGSRRATGIAVQNPGTLDAQVSVELLDSKGVAARCTGCSGVVPAGGGHLFWLPDLKPTDAAGAAVAEGEALVYADLPVVAAAVHVPLGAVTDHALQGGISVGADLVPPTTPQQPLILNNEAVPGLSAPILADLYLLNLDHRQPVEAQLVLFPWDGSTSTSRRPTIEPGRTAVMPLAIFSSISPGAYAAVLSGQAPLALVTRHGSPDTGSMAFGEAVWHDPIVSLPVVMKNSAGRCSIVAIRNTSVVSNTAITAELYDQDGGTPALQIGLGLAGSRSASVDLCTDSRFTNLADGFVGSMILRSADHPISAETLLAYDKRPGLAEYGGSVPWMSGTELLLPLLHSSWSYAGGDASVPTYDSSIFVSNHSRQPVVVTASYRGVLGACAGKSYADVIRTVPGLGSVVLQPGTAGTGILPASCLAAGVLNVANGEVMAEVLDEGAQQQQPVTPTATSTEPRVTDTPTEVPPVTPSATEVSTEPPTPGPSATATSTATTPAGTSRATSTFWPTSTPPPGNPKPPPSRVPPAEWTRANHSNSLLPYDNVRFLEIDRSGTTWLRLVDPSGGPDAVAKANPAGEWIVFGDVRAAVSALTSTAMDDLQSVRDFFDRDSLGRTWVGPEVLYDGTWHVVAVDDVSAAGGVSYDGRALLDPADHGWLPFRATGDCIPPAQCGNQGVRAFDVGGTLFADVALRTLSDPPRYGLDHAHLVSRGGSNGPGAAVQSSGSTADRQAAGAQRLGAQAQADANAAWLVAPDKLLVLPSTDPTYYPYLDPREFLVTGLRNSGYATAATLSPSGNLQVITWVEIDEGSRVLHRIVLNTLHGDTWEVEDLTPIDLFAGNAEFDRVVGMDYCTTGELWLVTALGGVAVRADGERRDGLWTTYSADQGLFDPGDLPSDIGCGEDGSVWIGSMNGLLGYGFEAPPVRVYAPFVGNGPR